jgi:lipoprotein-releasing system permease protein
MSARPFEWFIGTRYLRSGHRNGFISFISLISMIGLALGVMTLIVVLSVMNGFESELRQRILNMTAHATLIGDDGHLANWPRARDIAKGDPDVVAAAPYVEDQGMLIHGEHVSGTLIRGVLPAEEETVGSIAAHMTSGRLEDLRPGEYRIVLGEALARELDVGVGDSVIAIVAKGNTTPVGVIPRTRRFKVSGIFSAGMYEYDRGLALVAMGDAQRLYRLGADVSGVRLAFRDLFAAPMLVQRVARNVDGVHYVSDWTQKHANFFRSIEITKTIMFVILLLVVGVAAFNIVSTLVMIVREKQSDIAILRTVGTRQRSVLAIFIVQGALIGLLGTLAGVGLGVLASYNLEWLVHALEGMLGTQFMDAKVYFMSDLPARVEWGDLLRVGGTALLLCIASTLYPAFRAARTQPAEVLRHE